VLKRCPRQFQTALSVGGAGGDWDRSAAEDGSREGDDEERGEEVEQAVGAEGDDETCDEGASCAGHAHREVGGSLDGGAGIDGDRFGQEGRAGDEGAGPAETEEEQANAELPATVDSGSPGHDEGGEQDGAPGQDDRAASEAVGGHADEGGGGIHAGDVPADDEADDAQIGVAMLEMDMTADMTA
jgi:hypothetical protein